MILRGPSSDIARRLHIETGRILLCLQERCKETIQFIKDLEMMAHADYFVGSSTSGIPHIIATLRMTVYLKSQVCP